MSKLETGEISDPHLSTILALARALDCEPIAIFPLNVVAPAENGRDEKGERDGARLTQA